MIKRIKLSVKIPDLRSHTIWNHFLGHRNLVVHEVMNPCLEGKRCVQKVDLHRYTGPYSHSTTLLMGTGMTMLEQCVPSVALTHFFSRTACAVPSL